MKTIHKLYPVTIIPALLLSINFAHAAQSDLAATDIVTGNEVLIIQTGDSNLAYIDQDVGGINDGNRLTIHDNGTFNESYVFQSGRLNYASIHQNGSHNVSNLIQTGHGNSSDISQFGNRGSLSATQTGNNNRVIVRQQ